MADPEKDNNIPQKEGELTTPEKQNSTQENILSTPKKQSMGTQKSFDSLMMELFTKWKKSVE